MRYRTARRKLARDERVPRTPSIYTGVLCSDCGHYTHMIMSQNQVQVICNSNGAHKQCIRS